MQNIWAKLLDFIIHNHDIHAVTLKHTIDSLEDEGLIIIMYILITLIKLLEESLW